MATPVEIRKAAGGTAMKITWSDGPQIEYPALYLRENCQCAACRHELTGERLLNPSTLPKDLTILKSEIIGQYALGFLFSDGHSTGIYTFDLLRKIAP